MTKVACLSKFLKFAAAFGIWSFSVGGAVAQLPEQCTTRQRLITLTEGVLAELKPLFKQREAIQNRIAELSDRPSSQLKGLFDPDSNLTDLRSRAQLLDKQVQLIQERYEFERRALIALC